MYIPSYYYTPKVTYVTEEVSIGACCSAHDAACTPTIPQALRNGTATMLVDK
jgi:hypothetical protein